MLPDPLLAAIIRATSHNPDRLRRRLLDDAALRARYIAPLIKLWCEETIKEMNDGTL